MNAKKNKSGKIIGIICFIFLAAIIVGVFWCVDWYFNATEKSKEENISYAYNSAYQDGYEKALEKLTNSREWETRNIELITERVRIMERNTPSGLEVTEDFEDYLYEAF